MIKGDPFKEIEIPIYPQKEFREWFKNWFPLEEFKLIKLFKDFDYDGQSYIPKRLEKAEEVRSNPKGTTVIRKPKYRESNPN